MVKRKVGKATHLRKFEKMQSDLAKLDANFLLGNLKQSTYKNKRNILRNKFENQKKKLISEMANELGLKTKIIQKGKSPFENRLYKTLTKKYKKK